MAGARSFAIEPIHFEGLQVGQMLEGQWLATKTPQQQASYQADKQAMIQNFIERLTARNENLQIIAGPPPGPQTFVIRPILTFIEQGFFAYVANRDTEARMTIQILTPQGQIIDEIITYDRVTANLYNPSTGGRMRSVGVHLANHLTDYLRARTGVH